MEQEVFCLKSLRKLVFQDYSSKIQKEVKFRDTSQIFKLVKNFEAHGICKDVWTNSYHWEDLNDHSVGMSTH